jgi:alkylhydroperoxidase family enzyme
MTEAKLAQVNDPDNAVFSPRERAVLHFATAMSRNDNSQADALFAEMRKFYDDAQLVEIGFAITTLHGMNLFNNMFGIEPEDHPMESETGMRSAEAIA